MVSFVVFIKIQNLQTTPTELAGDYVVSAYSAFLAAVPSLIPKRKRACLQS